MIESNKKHLKIYLMVILTIMTILVSTQSLAVSKVEGLTVKMEGEKAHLEWQALPDASRYDVYVSVSGTGYKYLGSTSGNSANIKGFTPDTVYQVMVRALLKSGTAIAYSDFSEPVSIILKSSLDLELEGGITDNQMNVEKVTGLSAEVNGTQVALSWNRATGADGYEINVEIPNYGSQTFNVTSLRVTLGGVSRSGDYSVKVRGYKIDQTGQKIYGEFSEIVKFRKQDELQQVTTVGALTGLKAQVNGSDATLTWDKVDGAEGYECRIMSSAVALNIVYSESLRISGVTAGTNYTAQVRAFKTVNGQTIYGKEALVTFTGTIVNGAVILEQPANLKAQVTGKTAKISWNKVKEAQGYIVEISRIGQGASIEKRDVGNTTETTLNNMIEGERYTIIVRAYATMNGQRIYGKDANPITITAQVEKLAQVTGLKYKVTGQEVKLDWNKVTGAEGYEIDFGVPGVSNVTLKTTANSRIVSGLTETKYDYSARVRAYKTVNGQKIYGAYSTTVKFKGQDMTPKQVTGLTRKLTETKVTFNWNKMENVDGYEITLVVPKNGTYTYDTTQNSKTLNNIVIVNADYVATVKAYKIVDGKKLYGPASKELRFRGGVNTASKPTATLSGTNLTLKWPVTKAAEGYEISLTAPGGKTFTYSTSGTSKTISNIGDLKKDYTVKIRAYRKDENGRKIYGAYSPEIKFRGKVGNVTGLKSTVTGTALKLNWNSVYNAEGYELIIFVPGVGDFKYNLKTNSYSASNYVTIKGYDFTAKVRAYGKNEKGQTVYGDYSNTIKFRAK